MADVLWLQKSLRLRSAATNNRTERMIPLGEELLSLIRGGAPYDFAGRVPGEELVFRSPWGHLWRLPRTFRDWLQGLAKSAKIPLKDSDGRGLNVHALRHTFATRLTRAGVPLQQAAYLNGHKSLRVLMQIYTHLQADRVRPAVAKLSLGPAIPGTRLAHERREQAVASKASDARAR